MSKYLRRAKLYDMNEEETDSKEEQQTLSQNTSPDAARKAATRQKIVNLQSQIQRKENEINTLKSQIVLCNNELVKLGDDPVDLQSNESISYKFSTKLFEAVQNVGRTDELINCVKSAFDELPDISYSMDDKGCTSLAKRLLSFLNDQNWNDGADHWDEVADKIESIMNKSSISLSSREITIYIDKLAEVLRRSSMFAWIFGNTAATSFNDNSVAEDITDIDSYDDYDNFEDESLDYSTYSAPSRLLRR